MTNHSLTYGSFHLKSAAKSRFRNPTSQIWLKIGILTKFLTISSNANFFSILQSIPILWTIELTLPNLHFVEDRLATNFAPGVNTVLIFEVGLFLWYLLRYLGLVWNRLIFKDRPIFEEIRYVLHVLLLSSILDDRWARNLKLVDLYCSSLTNTPQSNIVPLVAYNKFIELNIGTCKYLTCAKPLSYRSPYCRVVTKHQRVAHFLRNHFLATLWCPNLVSYPYCRDKIVQIRPVTFIL